MANGLAMALPHRIWHCRLASIAMLFGLAGIFLPFTEFFGPVSAWDALILISPGQGDFLDLWIHVGVAGLLVALWLALALQH